MGRVAGLERTPDAQGYSYVSLNKKKLTGHVFIAIYEMGHTELLENHTRSRSNKLTVNHHCDNRICVRPSHLFIGTHTDRVSKDRQNKGSTVGIGKLKEEDIPKIWDSFSRGVQAKTIAADLNVDPTTVSYVLRKKTWIRETEKWESMNRKSWNSGIKMWANI